MSAIAAALRQAGGLFIEPAPAPAPRTLPVDVLVTGLGPGAGATTVARGLAMALARQGPVKLARLEGAGGVAAGPGIAVVRDACGAAAAGLVHRGPGRVVVAVADGRREPPLAAAIRDVLVERHERVLLVGNRAREPAQWRDRGALCMPDSRLGALLLGRGRSPAGPMRSAFGALAAAVERAATGGARTQNS